MRSKSCVSVASTVGTPWALTIWLYTLVKFAGAVSVIEVPFAVVNTPLSPGVAIHTRGASC